MSLFIETSFLFSTSYFIQIMFNYFFDLSVSEYARMKVGQIWQTPHASLFHWNPFFVRRVGDDNPVPENVTPHWNFLRVAGHCPTIVYVFMFTSGWHIAVCQLLQEGTAVHLKSRLELDPNKHVTASAVAMETVIASLQVRQSTRKIHIVIQFSCVYTVFRRIAQTAESTSEVFLYTTSFSFYNLMLSKFRWSGGIRAD